jgi:hypothetical protein
MVAGIETSVINEQSVVFGKEAPLPLTRGYIHEYVGIILHFSSRGKITITMEQFIQDILDEALESMAGMTTTPSANHLFYVNFVNPKLLSPAEAKKFCWKGDSGNSQVE